MSPNSIHDLPAPHIDVHHRKEAAPKIKEPKPLFSREPLPHDRPRKPSTRPQKKRKVVLPTTPALSFDPKRSYVPSGRQDPPASPSVYSRPSTSESSASSHDEQTSPFPDREIQDHYFNGYDAHRRPRIIPDYPCAERSASFYPDTPCTDASEMSSVPPHDCYEPSASCASSSSPAPLDQSSCPVQFPLQGIHSTHPMYAYGGHGYAQPPVVHPDYSYPMGPYPDRPAQNYSDTARDGPVPHGIPAYSGSNGYPYPPGRRY